MPEVHLLTGAYAMDALDDVERAGFEQHLRTCGSCAAEVIEFHEVTARLVGRVAMDPPEHLRATVLTEAGRTRQVSLAGRVPLRRPSLRRMLAMACAAAVIAGSAGLGGMAWQGHRAAQQATTAADRVAERAAQLAEVMTDPNRIEVVQPSTAGGTATIVAASGNAVLVTHRMTAPPAGKTYQVWLFNSKGVHSVELLKLRNGTGQSLVPGVSVGSSIGVTVEPAGGSAADHAAGTEPAGRLMKGGRAIATAGRGATAGLIAAALALGVAEVVAGALGRAVSPAIVVGGAAIDRTPRFLKEFAIEEFGENDKKVLLTGIFLTIGLIAAAVGVLATRNRRAGLVGVSLLGLVAAVAAATRPTFEPLDVLPSLVAAAVGALALGTLLRVLPQRPAVNAVTPVEPGKGVGKESLSPERPDRADQPPAPGARRRGVLIAVAMTVVAGVTGFGGRALQNLRANVDASRRDLVLPKPVTPAPALPAGAKLDDIRGISTFYTTNREFYRVDTALSVPRLTTDDWRLKIHGMVDRELDLSFADLLKRPIVEHDITLTCVSNEVGGKLLGTARWLGVDLAALLKEAGVKSGSDQLVGTSIDGMTIGTPVSAVTDGRAAMLAIAMNGEALLPEHGFPVRMIVPGLYGYVSATKWLVDLELSTFKAFDPYWVRRGWDQEAPIKTSSRIDTPKPLSTVKAGKIMVAGVAWAQHRGISEVEVRVDGGSWQKAKLSTSVNTDLWRQWSWEWDASAGAHTLQVRARDANGDGQLEERTAPFPNGSTGWQSVLVTVG